MKKLIIEIPVKAITTIVTTIELQLPFFGRVPGEDKYIFISSDGIGHEVNFWPTIKAFNYQERTDLKDMKFPSISDYIPITFEEWEAALNQIEEMMSVIKINLSYN
jgi:hypothetical protein